MNPFPSVGIQQADRQQICDIYPGILAQIPNFLPNETCWVDERPEYHVWVDEKQETNVWVPEHPRAGTWRKSTSGTSVWRSEGANRKSWTDEKEVQPCGD